MGMTVAELERRMPVSEFFEHWADYIIDPWGEQRADLRSGVIASILYNVHRMPKKPEKSASDFVLFKPHEPDEAELRLKARKRKRR